MDYFIIFNFFLSKQETFKYFQYRYERRWSWLGSIISFNHFFSICLLFYLLFCILYFSNPLSCKLNYFVFILFFAYYSAGFVRSVFIQTLTVLTLMIAFYNLNIQTLYILILTENLGHICFSLVTMESSMVWFALA